MQAGQAPPLLGQLIDQVDAQETRTAGNECRFHVLASLYSG
jgi:hypothetical protein